MIIRYSEGTIFFLFLVIIGLLLGILSQIGTLPWPNFVITVILVLAIIIILCLTAVAGERDMPEYCPEPVERPPETTLTSPPKSPRYSEQTIFK